VGNFIPAFLGILAPLLTDAADAAAIAICHAHMLHFHLADALK